MAAGIQETTRMTAVMVLAGVGIAAALAVAVVWLGREEGRPHERQLAAELDYDTVSRTVSLAEIERGRVYFAQLCTDCHGIGGDGHGEWAYRVTPRPAALTSSRVQRHDDDYLYRIIRDGQAGTSMPSWRDVLSPRQIRQVIDYLRYLGEQHAAVGDEA